MQASSQSGVVRPKGCLLDCDRFPEEAVSFFIAPLRGKCCGYENTKKALPVHSLEVRSFGVNVLEVGSASALAC